MKLKFEFGSGKVLKIAEHTVIHSGMGLRVGGGGGGGGEGGEGGGGEGGEGGEGEGGEGGTGENGSLDVTGR